MVLIGIGVGIVMVCSRGASPEVLQLPARGQLDPVLAGLFAALLAGVLLEVRRK
jgi:hypothetical protein